MKTATFRHDVQRSNNQTASIYGKVTLKDDGKTSISISNSKQYRSSEVWSAKLLAKAIVEADFKHTAVLQLTEVNAQGLVKILTQETQELKKAFIEKTVRYAQEKFKQAESRKGWTYEDYAANYGEVNSKYPISTLVNGERVVKTKELSKTAKAVKAETMDVLNTGLEKLIEREVKYAEMHYEQSIKSLAVRLNKKGIKDDTKMTIQTATLGQHITTTIEHEGTITKAWTIIAEGEIQRPHYRYLVK